MLAAISLVIGVGDLDVASFLSGGSDDQALLLLVVSRIPRTVAIVLAGMSMGVAAVVMQLLFRNRFVEPTTAGTAEAASLGLLAATLLTPGLPVMGKMLIAAGFALAGSFLFLRIVSRIPARSTLIVPLVGLMLGGVIDALTTFFAYRYDLLQSLGAWTSGDFSGVLRGRYELLWISFALVIATYVTADRFTVAGLGDAATTNLGLDYRKIVSLGLTMVALITAACVVTSGMVPFLGLIVANVVSMLLGDNLRRSLPWIALSGAAFLLVCDIIGRLIRFPYEIPVGTVAGVLGSAIFLYLLLAGRRRLG
jgi:iron complex transport system permease protein